MILPVNLCTLIPSALQRICYLSAIVLPATVYFWYIYNCKFFNLNHFLFLSEWDTTQGMQKFFNLFLPSEISVLQDLFML